MKWQLDYENQLIKCCYGGNYFIVFRDGGEHSLIKSAARGTGPEVSYFSLLSRRYASATTSDCTRHSVAD